GERLGELGLPDARGSEEDERARGSLGVLQASARAADRLADRRDRVLLADDPLVELVLHAEQLLGLLLGELEDGDAGPGGEHLGDLLLVHLGQDVHLARLPLAFATLALLDELALLVAQRRGLLEVLRVDRALLAETDLGDLLV